VPPTAITPSVRFFRPGTTKVYWVTTIVTYTAPTRVEINLGKDLSGEIAEITGFTVVSDTIPTPDLGTAFVPKIGGRINADDSSLNFYATSTGFTDARSVLPRSTTGFLIIMDGGDVSTTGRMDVYPATVTSVPKLRALEDPAQVQVTFAITRVPAEDVVIPA
jgi:hypothetical protein